MTTNIKSAACCDTKWPPKVPFQMSKICFLFMLGMGKQPKREASDVRQTLKNMKLERQLEDGCARFH